MRELAKINIEKFYIYQLRFVSLTKTPNESKLNRNKIFYSRLCFQNIFKSPSISNYGNTDSTSTLFILVSLKYFVLFFHLQDVHGLFERG